MANRKLLKITLESGELSISSWVHRYFVPSISKTERFISIPQQFHVLPSHQKVSSFSQHPMKKFLVLFVLQYSCQVLDTWILMTFWNPALLSILRALIPGSHLYKHKRPNWSFSFDLSNLLSTCGQRLFLKHKSITWRKQQPFYVSWREDSHRPRLSEWSQQLVATHGSAGSSKGRSAPQLPPEHIVSNLQTAGSCTGQRSQALP